MAVRQRCVFPWRGGGDDNSEWSRGGAARAALFEVKIPVPPLISTNALRFVDVE